MRFARRTLTLTALTALSALLADDWVSAALCAGRALAMDRVYGPRTLPSSVPFPEAHEPRLPALLADSPVRGRGADRFQYDLVIEDDSGRRELTVSEDRMPDELRSLVDRVKAAGSGA